MVYLRRLVWFLAGKFAVWTAALGAIVCAFFMCMNTTNIYVVLSEGMEKRVDAILTLSDVDRLNDYFHADFLSGDPALTGALQGSSAFSDYRILDYDYELSIDSLWAWPWDDYATCSITELVTGIEGSVLPSRADEVPADVPAWQGGKYNITLVRVGGKWKVIGMQQTAVIAEASTVGEE